MTETAAPPPQADPANTPGPKPVPEDKTAPKPAAKKPAKKPAAPKPEVVVRPVASPARRKRRHWGLILAFLIMVIAPIGVTYWYLTTKAADQYASTLGFTVRSEEGTSSADLFTGLTANLGVSGGGARDSDILYEYIRSAEIVADIDAELGLRSVYSRYTDGDPVFGFHTDGTFLGMTMNGTIEDLTAYWQRMVRISYDQTSGLIEVTALAFEPEEARAIAQAIYDFSLIRINELSAIAREDATRYASADLELAGETLKAAREALTAFRAENRIVDLEADLLGQMGVLNTLQAQLAEAQIELDLLRLGDPRIDSVEQRIAAIEARIQQERDKFGSDAAGPGGTSYATTVAEFERLTVEREIAEQFYVTALAAYNGAVAEANRQSLYLAAYIRPTLAERSQYPQRAMIIGLVALFSFLAWAISSLVYYSLRDRR